MGQELESAVKHMQDLTEISLFVQLVLGIVTGTLTGLTGASGMSVLISVLLTLKAPAQRLCHVNSDEPNMLALSQIKQPLFRTIERMPWRAFDGEYGERSSGAAN